MALSLGVVEKEYNQLLKERTQLQESVQRLEEDLGKIKIHMDDDVKLNDIFDLDAPVRQDDHVSLDGIEDL